MRMLISGFEAFAGRGFNPSKWLVESVDPDPLLAELHRVVLPVEFDRAFQRLEQEIRRLQPDVVISLGLAMGRKKVSLEKVAINWRHARIADNDGNQPLAQSIVAEGPAAYFTSLPVEALEQVDPENLEISYSAGTYVCNELMYRILHLSKTEGFRSGFIHVPDPELAASIDLDHQKDLLEVLIFQLCRQINEESAGS